MTDEQYKDMVIGHDKHIDSLTSSISILADSVGSTNSKLDNVIDVITQQNVLVERMNNMDHNVVESFNRAWVRIDKLEKIASNDGCEAAKLLQKDKLMIEDKLKVTNSRVADLEADTKGISIRIREYVSGATVKWAMGILAFYAVTFGAYTVTSTHDMDTTVSAYIAKDTEARNTINKRLDSLVARGNTPIIFSAGLPGMQSIDTPHNIMYNTKIK